MFNLTNSNKYKTFNFSFAVKFTEGIDSRKTIRVVNNVINMYSFNTFIGFSKPDKDGILCWNMVNVKMKKGFHPKKLFDNIECNLVGVSHIAMLDFNEGLGIFNHYKGDNVNEELAVKMFNQCRVKFERYV